MYQQEQEKTNRLANCLKFFDASQYESIYGNERFYINEKGVILKTYVPSTRRKCDPPKVVGRLGYVEKSDGSAVEWVIESNKLFIYYKTRRGFVSKAGGYNRVVP